MIMSAAITAYRTVAWLAHRAPPTSAKLAASLAGRRGAAEYWERWARSHRTEGPLLWVHGASVGELTSSLPVVARMRRAVDRLHVVYTHSSPSAAGWRLDGDSPLGFLPLDEAAHARRALAALKPALLLFACGDVWPELTVQATAAGIPVAVSGARARAGTWRATPPGRAFFAPIYRALAWVGARSEEDAAVWRTAGVPPERVVVTGDPRHDHVIERVPRLQAVMALLSWAAARRVLVAGSTHADDEALVLRAARTALTADATVGLIVVPHDPTPERVSALVTRCERENLPVARWRRSDPAPHAPVIVVESLGDLADLYALGMIAFVGGGCGSHGVHAVVEPAAWGVPVVVGPRANQDRDTRLLLRTGGARLLPRHAAVETLVATWMEWRDDHLRAVAGQAARRALESGAADATAAALLEHLPAIARR